MSAATSKESLRSPAASAVTNGKEDCLSSHRTRRFLCLLKTLPTVRQSTSFGTSMEKFKKFVEG